VLGKRLNGTFLNIFEKIGTIHGYLAEIQAYGVNNDYAPIYFLY
jgi:hypothetical protein